MTHRLVTATVFILVFLTATLRGQDAKKELDKLQGTWSVTAMEMDENQVPPDSVKGTVTFKGDLMVVAGLSPKPAEHKVKLDPSKKPKSLDVTNDGKGKLGIYQLEGDEMKVCLPIGRRTERPTEFKSAKGSNLVIMTLERSKK
jgi:uncharacterized protein (TIGR03067 family)